MNVFPKITFNFFMCCCHVADWVLAGGEARVAGSFHLAIAAWGVNLIAKALR